MQLDPQKSYSYPPHSTWYRGKKWSLNNSLGLLLVCIATLNISMNWVFPGHNWCWCWALVNLGRTRMWNQLWDWVKCKNHNNYLLGSYTFGKRGKIIPFLQQWFCDLWTNVIIFGLIDPCTLIHILIFSGTDFSCSFFAFSCIWSGCMPNECICFWCRVIPAAAPIEFGHIKHWTWEQGFLVK